SACDGGTRREPVGVLRVGGGAAFGRSGGGRAAVGGERGGDRARARRVTRGRRYLPQRQRAGSPVRQQTTMRAIVIAAQAASETANQPPVPAEAAAAVTRPVKITAQMPIIAQ